MIFLEINDWQLTLRDSQGLVQTRQPAAASSAAGGLVFGADALARSRSHPQQFNNRYLSSLSADPVAGDLGSARNHADLVYEHVKALDLDPAVAVGLAIPGYLTNDQLGLLLGIFQETGLAVSGFVETGLAQALHLPGGSATHLLDIEMHRLCLTQLTFQEEQIAATKTNSLDGFGVANIVDGWMNVIADEFVHKTRFDPMHAGQSEQQLFDNVYGWLGHAEVSPQRVRVNQGEAVREMEVSARQLDDKLRQRLSAAEFGELGTLAVTPRVLAVPGLASALESAGCTLIRVDENTIAANYAALRADLEREGVRRITSARTRSNGEVAAPAAISSKQTATHLLADHHATALDSARFVPIFDPSTAACRDRNVKINGMFAELGQTLHPGDEVECLGATFTAIRLE